MHLDSGRQSAGAGIRRHVHTKTKTGIRTKGAGIKAGLTANAGRAFTYAAGAGLTSADASAAARGLSTNAGRSFATAARGFAGSFARPDTSTTTTSIAGASNATSLARTGIAGAHTGASIARTRITCAGRAFARTFTRTRACTFARALASEPLQNAGHGITIAVNLKLRGKVGLGNCSGLQPPVICAASSAVKP